jgi:hypothetical protein
VVNTAHAGETAKGKKWSSVLKDTHPYAINFFFSGYLKRERRLGGAQLARICHFRIPFQLLEVVLKPYLWAIRMRQLIETG